MRKVYTKTKAIGRIRMILSAGIFTLFPVTAFAELQSFAAQVNGESLMYFILLLFIGYLFFRKPLP